MNNELTLWNQSTMQPAFDLTVEITETRKLLEEFNASLKVTSDLALKIGHKLRNIQEKSRHGEFLPLLDSEFGMSRMTAYRFMSLAEAEMEDPDKFNIMLNFPLYLQYKLAHASMDVVKQLEAGEIPATVQGIQQAQRAWLEAKERADQLEQRVMHLVEDNYQLANENEHLKEQELLYKQVEATKARQAQERELELRRKEEEAQELAEAKKFQEQELENMKKQLAEAAKPIVVTETKEIEVEKLVEVEKVVRDEEEVKRLQSELEKKELQYQKKIEEYEAAQNDLAVLAERNKQLNEESRRNFAETHAIVGRLRIKQEWQMATSEIIGNHYKFDSRIPTPIDREAFEGEEHTRTRQCIEAMENTIALLKQTLPQASNIIHLRDIVDAEVVQ